MTTWDDFNNQIGTGNTSGSAKWALLNKQLSSQAFTLEARSQSEIDTALFKELRERGNLASDFKSLEAEKISFLKEVGSNASKALNRTIKFVRGTTQFIATPLAGLFASVPGGVTPKEAMKQSVEDARRMILDQKLPFDEGVQKAAQLHLKSRGIGKYGNNQANALDIGVLAMLGFFNIFGDPALEFGLGVK